MSFAELFRGLRAELGLTQAEMSECLKVCQSTLCKIEKGRLEPNVWTFLYAYRLSRTTTSKAVEDAFLRTIYKSRRPS